MEIHSYGRIVRKGNLFEYNSDDLINPDKLPILGFTNADNISITEYVRAIFFDNNQVIVSP